MSTAQPTYLFNADSRSDSDILSSLLERGIGASFDLREWSTRARSCSSIPSAREKLKLLLEPVRTDVAKLITLQALENDASRASLRDECVYGEITVQSFEHDILCQLPQWMSDCSSENVCFYDLGSGTGKNVFLAAISGIFHRAVGIEILAELASIGEVLNASFVEDVVGGCGSVVVGRKDGGSYGSLESGVCGDDTEVRKPRSIASTELRLGSFLRDIEWVKVADVVYFHALMFDEVTMTALAALAKGMKKGSLFITTGQDLMSFFVDTDEVASGGLLQHSCGFEIVQTFQTNHSFASGIDTFVHKRI